MTPLCTALADPHLAVRVAACQGLAHQEHDGAMLYEPALPGDAGESAAALTAVLPVSVPAVIAGREAAIRALQATGLDVTAIRDLTPIPHNGCRAPKRRRV